MRARLRIGLLLASAAAMIAIASWASGRGSPAPQVLAYAKGALSLRNSRNGEPIFSASNIAPGDWVRGGVTISNAGHHSGQLSLSPAHLVDTVGPNGGRLSSRLHLTIKDVTGGSARLVYSGKLAAMRVRYLGCLERGAARTYRFVARFPDGGQPPSANTGDNAFQGSSLRVDYVWSLKFADCALGRHRGRRRP